MKINYPAAGVVIALAVIFIIYLIRRNHKDERSFEHDLERSELKPGENQDDVNPF